MNYGLSCSWLSKMDQWHSVVQLYLCWYMCISNYLRAIRAYTCEHIVIHRGLMRADKVLANRVQQRKISGTEVRKGLEDGRMGLRFYWSMVFGKGQHKAGQLCLSQGRKAQAHSAETWSFWLQHRVQELPCILPPKTLFYRRFRPHSTCLPIQERLPLSKTLDFHLMESGSILILLYCPVPESHDKIQILHREWESILSGCTLHKQYNHVWWLCV